MKDKKFFVYPDEIKDKINHRMIHVDTETGQAVEYDRKSMLNYLDNTPDLIKTDKNNNRYAIIETFSKLLQRRVDHFRPFKIKLA
jgi:hypothetical protein